MDQIHDLHAALVDNIARCGAIGTLGAVTAAFLDLAETDLENADLWHKAAEQMDNFIDSFPFRTL